MPANAFEFPETDKSYLQGAINILQHGLGLTEDQQLLIFADETTSEVATIIAQAAVTLNVPHTIVFVPRSLQRLIPESLELSPLVLGAADEVRAVVTCVSGGPEGLPFRDYAKRGFWSANRKVGTMPGASFEVLKLGNVDYTQLRNDCHRLEIAMQRGNTLKLWSWSANGDRHQLTANIGGWTRLPIASDGTIQNGMWGNVPSGETYIAPMENTAEGSVVINGSIPGKALINDEIILHFHKGHLVRIEPEDSPTACFLDENEFRAAREKGDAGWSNLAEIGIGVNSAVDHLTGNMLFDEKKEGTAHVALGKNTTMGGIVESLIHCDMVINAPTITIDDKPVLERGQIVISDGDWRENYRNVQVSPRLASATRIARAALETRQSEEKLQRYALSEPNRRSMCFVGDDETAAEVVHIYNRLPADNQWISRDRLLKSVGISEQDVVLRLLQVMLDYEVISVGK